MKKQVKSEIKRVEKHGSHLLIVMESDATLLLTPQDLACLAYFFGTSVEHVIKHNEALFDQFRDDLKPKYLKRQHLRVIK